MKAEIGTEGGTRNPSRGEADILTTDYQEEVRMAG